MIIRPIDELAWLCALAHEGLKAIDVDASMAMCKLANYYFFECANRQACLWLNSWSHQLTLVDVMVLIIERCNKMVNKHYLNLYCRSMYYLLTGNEYASQD